MRLDGWPEKLGNFTMYRRLFPYAWGTNDCVTFAADAVWAITGEDPIADIRGQWDSEESAMTVLESLGGLVKAMDDRFPRRESPAFTNRGDVCMVKINGMASLGISVGHHCAAPADDGMRLIDMSEVRISWEV